MNIPRIPWINPIDRAIMEREAREETADLPPGTVTRAALAPEVAAAVDQVPEIRGRHELVLYDEFARYPDGPLNGISPLIGPAWFVTGGSPIVVVNGRASSTTDTTGYLIANFGDPVNYLEATMIARGDAVSGDMTIAWLDAANTLGDLVHLNIGPAGFNLTLRQDGETPGGIFVPFFTGSWVQRVPCDNMTEFRVGILARGDTVLVIGPNGEVFSGVDPRVAVIVSEGSTFWEPVGGANGGIDLVACRAVRVPDTIMPETLLSTMDFAAIGRMTGSAGTVVANRGQWQETTIGSQQPGSRASIVFGPKEIRTRIVTAAAIGGTTIITEEPIPSGSTLRVGGGDNAEDIVTTGNPAPLPGVGYPYTHTLATPLTKAHAIGTVVIATGLPAQSVIYHDQFAPIKLATSGDMVINGKVYIGPGFTAYVSQPVANVIGTGPDDCLRTGKGITSARPSATAVQSGSQWFDTTLNKPIWSDGAAWRDAAGTVV